MTESNKALSSGKIIKSSFIIRKRGKTPRSRGGYVQIVINRGVYHHAHERNTARRRIRAIIQNMRTPLACPVTIIIRGQLVKQFDPLKSELLSALSFYYVH